MAGAGGSALGPRAGVLEPVFVTACLLLHAVLAWALRAPGIGTGQDDAIYLLLGRALQHLNYRDIWLVGHPIESRYPPGFPALLALMGAGTGVRIDQAVVLNILCSVAALLVFYRLVRRDAGALALVLLPVVALNPGLVGAAGKVASEPLYLLCSLLALQVASTRSGRRASMLAAALVLGAALVRSAGVVLLAALGLAWLFQRRWREVAGLALAGSLTVGAWLGWTIVAPGQYAGHSYVADALLGSEPPIAPAPSVRDSGAASLAPPAPVAPDLAPTSGPTAPAAAAAGIVGRVRHNALAYAAHALPAALAVPTLPGTWVDNLVAALVLATGLAVGLWSRRRRTPLVIGYLALYGLLLLAWPYALTRFLIPVVPLVLWLTLAGLGELVSVGRARARLLVPSLVAAGLVLSGASSLRATWARVRRCDRGAPRHATACFNPDQLAFFRGVEAIDTLAPAGSPLLTAKGATIYWLTGRSSVEELAAASLDPAALSVFLDRQGVSHIFLSRIHLDQRTIAAALQPRCAELEFLAEPAPGALVLRRRAPADEGSNGCAALVRFLAGPWSEDD